MTHKAFQALIHNPQKDAKLRQILQQHQAYIRDHTYISLSNVMEVSISILHFLQKLYPVHNFTLPISTYWALPCGLIFILVSACTSIHKLTNFQGNSNSQQHRFKTTSETLQNPVVTIIKIHYIHHIRTQINCSYNKNTRMQNPQLLYHCACTGIGHAIHCSYMYGAVSFQFNTG